MIPIAKQEPSTVTQEITPVNNSTDSIKDKELAPTSSTKENDTDETKRLRNKKKRERRKAKRTSDKTEDKEDSSGSTSNNTQ